MSDHTVYTNNGEYLDAELGWLAVRAKRLGVERRQRERAIDSSPKDETVVGEEPLVLDDELVRRGAALKVREASLRAEIDARLAATRAAKGDTFLGLDRLCAENGLGPDERLVLLVALAPVAGDEVGQMTTGEVAGSYFISPTCETVVSFLDARGIFQRVKYRALFEPRAPLIKGGLITCDYGRKAKAAEDVLDARIRLTTTALDVLVGLCDSAQVQ